MWAAMPRHQADAAGNRAGAAIGTFSNPAPAGTRLAKFLKIRKDWIPAVAGMTNFVGFEKAGPKTKLHGWRGFQDAFVPKAASNGDLHELSPRVARDDKWTLPAASVAPATVPADRQYLKSI